MSGTITIEVVAAEIARRFDAVRMRTEDRLNDEYLQRVIREIATEVLSQIVLPTRSVWGEEDLQRVQHNEQQHDASVARMSLVLVGRAPQAQAAILAELLAIWLAGHAPPTREDQLTTWIELTRHLVPIKEKEMFGPKGYPFT